jgi:hypothetical protein
MINLRQRSRVSAQSGRNHHRWCESTGLTELWLRLLLGWRWAALVRWVFAAAGIARIAVTASCRGVVVADRGGRGHHRARHRRSGGIGTVEPGSSLTLPPSATHLLK